jgi:hypothetical protein
VIAVVEWEGRGWDGMEGCDKKRERREEIEKAGEIEEEREKGSGK